MVSPIQHDSPGEIAQAFEPKDWKRGECEPIPGKTMANVAVVERDYPNLNLGKVDWLEGTLTGKREAAE